MADADWRPRGLLFDLFGTLVFFDATRLPRIRVGGVERPGTIADPEELLARLTPPPTLELLIESLRSVTQAFVAESGATHAEMSSPERFRRALSALSVRGNVEGVAAELSHRHMHGLSQAVVCPPDRVSLLDALKAHYDIALVSNFDHTPTAHALLGRHGLRDRFRAVVISEAIGLRKPHASLFLTACDNLDLAPRDCLHIGDSHEADVCGAVAAGLTALWIDASDAPMAPALDRISDVRELPHWLETRL